MTTSTAPQSPVPVAPDMAACLPYPDFGDGSIFVHTRFCLKKDGSQQNGPQTNKSHGVPEILSVPLCRTAETQNGIARSRVWQWRGIYVACVLAPQEGDVTTMVKRVALRDEPAINGLLSFPSWSI